MDVWAHVALLGQDRLSGVDAHAYPELDFVFEVMGGQGSLRLDRPGDGVVGFGKGVEEGVSLGVDLDAFVG